ncbi:response regulator transcription factor [Comamonas piscis]|jgi:DNA-binding NarL/FixJ family response regulator|uniref:Response regulator transcription factor n=2 Tax=Comamonas TaxID=283 RepID=A0A7G5ENB4_9BURK|nr:MULTISPECIES: response regulator transcription factor [Comamonas]MDR2328060.1 response regulator transcription factor [Comamonas sp.]MCD2167061.1 response regulator transcription factor [Comamonas koreensis]QMV75489.1 response regulator transcription factor [Comamonas piscis]TDS83257.1 LuxR family two component transcriptional regulator [Comamonas sp. JUb58]WSO33997.1 response regulator transcription factor [Comamonas piscis]
MSPPALLVADDHPLFRAAVVQVIRGRFGAFEVLEASSASSLSAALAAHPGIELVLLDLTMPGTHGFSALLHVRGAYPQLPVVVISSNDHPRIIRRAQQFGASGFISKAAAADAITAAIEAVLEGDTVFPSMAAELSQEDAELAARLAQLTPHQFKTLLYLADGLLNKQIAQEMGVTEHTVKVHVTAILKKLGCHSRTQVAVLVRNLEADGGMPTDDSALP